MKTKKICHTCCWAMETPTELFDKICLRCKKHNKWQAISKNTTLPQPSKDIDPYYTWSPIQPCVYEATIHMYDRYMEVVLTAPVKEGSPDTMNMSEFINHLIVRGLMSYSEFLLPMEKELGIV